MAQITIQESLEARFNLVKSTVTVGMAQDFERYLAEEDYAGAAQFLAYIQDNISDDYTEFPL